jgi:biopolymer transport protein ExbD
VPLKTTAEEPISLNLTSMIDVLFLLILFFMAATKFSEMDHKLVVRIPRVKDAQGLPAATSAKTVSVAGDGRIAFAGQPVTLAALPRVLAEAKRKDPGLKVSVRCDGEVKQQRFAEVLVACRDVAFAIDLPVAQKLR